jgi:NB-ARC domain
MEQDTQRRSTNAAFKGELHWDIDDAPSSPPQIKNHARNISLVFSDTGPLSEIDEDDDEAHDDNDYADENGSAVEQAADDEYDSEAELPADGIDAQEEEQEGAAANWAADSDDDDDDDAWASAREASISPVWAGSAPAVWGAADDDTDDTAAAAPAAAAFAEGTADTESPGSDAWASTGYAFRTSAWASTAMPAEAAIAAPFGKQKVVISDKMKQRLEHFEALLEQLERVRADPTLARAASDSLLLQEPSTIRADTADAVNAGTAIGNLDDGAAAVATAATAAADGSASATAGTGAAAGVAKVTAVKAKQVVVAEQIVLATTEYDHSTLTAGLEQFISVVNATSAAGVRGGLAPLTVCMRRLHSAVAALVQPPARSYIPHARRFAQVLRLYLHAWQAMAVPEGLHTGLTQQLQQLSSSEAETALQLSAHALRVTHLADSLCSAVPLLALLNRGAVAQQSTAVLAAAAAVGRDAAAPTVSPTTARKYVPLPPPLPRHNLATESSSSKVQRAPLHAVDEVTAMFIGDEMAEVMQKRFRTCLSALPHCSLQYAAAAAVTDAQAISALAALISPCLAQPVQAADMIELARKACPLAYATTTCSSSSSSSSSTSVHTLPRGCPALTAHSTAIAVRADVVEQLVLKLLMRKCSKRWLQPILVTGPQSSGKTLLAAAAVSRADVCARFKGAVFWLTLGPMQPPNTAALLQHTAHSSDRSAAHEQQQQLHVPLHTHLPARYCLLLEHLACQLCMYIGGSCSVPWGAQLPSETELVEWLTAELAVLQSVHSTDCLLVADDLWERATLDRLTRLGFHVLATASAAGELGCSMAITTTAATIAATGAAGATAGAMTSDCDVIVVDRLDDTQAFELLTHTAGVSGGHKVLLQHSSVTASILSYCRGLPLALNMIGAVLHGHATDAAMWSSTAAKLQEAIASTTSVISDANTAASADAVALQSATLVCIGSLSSELQQLYMSMAILPQYVPVSEKMLRSLWSNVDHDTFAAVTDALLFRSLLTAVHSGTASGSSSSSSRSESPTAAVLYTMHAAQMECLRTQCGTSLQLQEQLEIAASSYTYYLGQLKVLKAAQAAPPWGPASATAVAIGDAHVPYGRLGLSSCWCVLQAVFDITAVEAYSDSLAAAGAAQLTSSAAYTTVKGSSDTSSSNSNTVTTVDASLAGHQLRVADYLMCSSSQQQSSLSGDTATTDSCTTTAATAVQTALLLYSTCAKQFDTLALPTGHSYNNSSVDSSATSDVLSNSPSPRTRSVYTNLRHQIAARKGIGRCLSVVGRGADGVQQYSKGMLLEQALYDSIQRQQQQQQVSDNSHQFSIQQQQQQLHHPQLLYSAVEHCKLCSSSSVSSSTSKQAWQDLIETLQVSASAKYSLAAAVCLRALASYDSTATTAAASTSRNPSKQQQQHQQKLLLHAVKLEESRYGTRHPALATALLTAAVQIQPCSTKSIQLCKRAVRVYERTLGARCSEVAVALQVLSDMHVKLQQYADACEALQRALSIVKLLPQRSSSDTNSSSSSSSSSNAAAVLMQRLAAVHVLQGSAGDIAIAEQLLRRALALQLESIAGQRTLAAAVVAGGSVHVLQAQRLLAQHLLAYSAEDTIVEITTLLEEALALSVSTLGAEHSDTLAVLQSLVAVKQAQGIVS